MNEWPKKENDPLGGDPRGNEYDIEVEYMEDPMVMPEKK